MVMRMKAIDEEIVEINLKIEFFFFFSCHVFNLFGINL